MKRSKNAFTNPFVIAAMCFASIGLRLVIAAIPFGLLMISQAHKYADGAPVISLDENYHVRPDTTVALSEFAAAENVSNFGIDSVQWADGSIAELSISGDGQSINIGDRTGAVAVRLHYDKQVGEASPCTVYVYVDE
ncbi:MAG TPA: hypothetical protein DDX71_05630 [Ruminococcus sp.]|nr:hypothetical protein [Ruminococcus sp.]